MIKRWQGSIFQWSFLDFSSVKMFKEARQSCICLQIVKIHHCTIWYNFPLFHIPVLYIINILQYIRPKEKLIPKIKKFRHNIHYSTCAGMSITGKTEAHLSCSFQTSLLWLQQFCWISCCITSHLVQVTSDHSDILMVLEVEILQETNTSCICSFTLLLNS